MEMSYGIADSEGNYEEKYKNIEQSNYKMKMAGNVPNDETSIQRPISPKSLGYMKKHKVLLEYYNHYQQQILGVIDGAEQGTDTVHSSIQNMRLRNRIYHVKKVINTLKNIKRVCMERIAMENCSLVLDTNLVIPDNEFGANLMDKVIGDVVGGTSTISNPMPAKRRRTVEPKKEIKKEGRAKSSTTISQKRKLLELVNDIVEEVHEASRVISPNNAPSFADPQKPSVSANSSQNEPNSDSKNIFSSRDTSFHSGMVNLEGLSESDFSSDGMTDRFLRESSIDHLLPEKPDYECERKQETKPKNSDETKMATLFSETEESSQHSDSTAFLTASNPEPNSSFKNPTEDVSVNLELTSSELQAKALTKHLGYENITANIP